MKCFEENGKPSDEFVLAELRDDGLYEITCNEGHTTLTLLQEQKFEILFDSGALALLDGYPREAIASIAASLERLLEFYIKIICLKNDIDMENFDKAWKEVSNQSERQYGAFHFLYLIENKKPLEKSLSKIKPDSQTKTWSNFRNDVIHKGYIPSYNEAFTYIDMIYRFMVSIIEVLKNNYAHLVQKTVFDHIKKIRKPKKGEQIATMTISTLINLASAEKQEKDFEKALERLKKSKKWLYNKN